MSRLILVSGSNGSGKSRFAEQLIAQTTGARFYIATMVPCTADNQKRVEKHRRQRAGLGFQTLEIPHEVSTAPVTEDSVVLLEDVSNLFANAMFEKGRGVDDVYKDILGLAERCKLLVAVTISGLTDNGYDAETAAYIDGLNALNRKLFSDASAAVSMQDGQPVYIKEEHNDPV